MVLDDDAYPDCSALSLAVSAMENDKKIVCIAFNVLHSNKEINYRTDWLPSLDVKKCEWPIFVGCAAAFDLEKIPNLRMPNDYFLYQHELPVAAEVYAAGFTIQYDKNIRAYHNFKITNKISRNRISFGLKYSSFRI